MRAFDYTYTGNSLTPQVEDPGSVLPPDWIRTRSGFNFTMRLDESQMLGGSLRNATVTWSACWQCMDPHIFAPGLVEIRNFGDPWFGDFQSWGAVDGPMPVQGLDMTFSTNSDREIVSLRLSAWLYPEDPFSFGIDSTYGDYYSETHNALASWAGIPHIFWSNPTPGNWTVAPAGTHPVAPIPLPATAALMLAGLAAFGAIRRRAV